MIVAFLQNPYFKAGTSDTIIMRYRDDQNFHRRILAHSNTGRRLQMAFGDMYDKIHWDNANWRHTTVAAGKRPPDPEHIDRVLTLKQPDVVIAFGRVAEGAVATLVAKFGIKLVSCTHPSAFGNTMQVLNDFARLIRKEYSQFL